MERLGKSSDQAATLRNDRPQILVKKYRFWFTTSAIIEHLDYRSSLTYTYDFTQSRTT